MMALSNIQLTPQLVLAVRDNVDIVDIAGEHTRLRKAGRRHAGLCPLHKEKTPSFSVDPDQGLFYCFGCGVGGDAIKLHMLLSGDDFPAAIESLAKRYGIPLPKERPRRGGDRRELDLEPVLEAAAEFFVDRLRGSPGPRAYLEKRRIPAELVESYGVGYAPDDWRQLIGALHPAFSHQLLETAGLIARSEKRPDDPYDRFRNRLMFPIRNASGRLVGFGGRTLGDDTAKYINTAETRQFHKGRLLYGLDLAKRSIRERGGALLVEGYFDVLGAAAAGLDHAVASMGTALTPEQAKLLGRFADEVVVGYDGDEAGWRAYRKTLPLLLAESVGVRRLKLPAGHDPDSLRLEAGDEALVGLCENAPDAVTLEIERLTAAGAGAEPRELASAGAALVELLRPVPDEILRFSHARDAAARLGVPVDLLWKKLAPRGAPAPPPPEGEPPAGRRQTSEVRSVEEKLLQILLAGEVELPPPAELPPEEAFLDPTCRNIYAVFRALYGDEGAERPAPRSVLDGLARESDAVDRTARLLLEGPVAGGAEELRSSMDQLKRRWRQQRLRELSAEIGRAQREGDRERLERLVNEKTTVSHALHRRPGE